MEKKQVSIMIESNHDVLFLLILTSQHEKMGVSYACNLYTYNSLEAFTLWTSGIYIYIYVYYRVIFMEAWASLEDPLKVNEWNKIRKLENA